MSAPVAVIGATGFIGSCLVERLTNAGIPVTGVSRSNAPCVPGVSHWMKPDTMNLSSHAAVINLSGEPVNQRWTRRTKRVLEDSRIGMTRRLVGHLENLPAELRPSLLINGSGVGIYGDRSDALLNESATPGNDYLARLCAEWEAAAYGAERLGIRVVTLRTGIVLGKGGAAFDKLYTIFRLGFGGKLGSGSQWMSWIHIDDQISGILHVLKSPFVHGPVNFNAPHPERNADFTRKFAAAVGRPVFLSVPSFAVKLAFGGFGAALLGGQRAVPEALLRTDFDFTFPTLEEALADLLP